MPASVAWNQALPGRTSNLSHHPDTFLNCNDRFDRHWVMLVFTLEHCQGTHDVPTAPILHHKDAFRQRAMERPCADIKRIVQNLLLDRWDEHPLHPVCNLFPQRCLLRLRLQCADRCSLRAKLRAGTISKRCVAVRDAVGGRLPV